MSLALRSIGSAVTVMAGGLAWASADGVGTIEGRVAFSGTPPPPTIVFEGGGVQHVLHLGERQGLRYAVAFLAGAPTEAAGNDTPATVSQVGFIFDPPVLAVREGQAVRFTNEDGANHNVRAEHALPANRLDAYTGAGQAHTHRFRADPGGSPVSVTCRVHPWMAAWIYVFPHPRFSVTDVGGRFRIERVPAGEHRVSIRHPAGGLARDLTVRVEAGATSRAEVVFDSSDLAPPPSP